MIGVFDSGIGGLTALGSLRAALPSADLTFLADRGNSPYGTKSEDELIPIVRNAIGLLTERGADAILIACCTASTVFCRLSEDEKKICTPIIAPTARRAAQLTKNRRIAVLATERTVASHAFKSEITAILPDAEVFEFSMQRLVALAESGECGAYVSPRAREEIDSLLLPLDALGADTVILGCTHFPIYKDVIKNRFRASNVISCSEEGALALAKRTNDVGRGRLRFIFR